jgi:hypothetical protein
MNPLENVWMIVALRKALLYTDIGLPVYRSAITHIGAGRMTLSVVSRKFDMDDIDFVEIGH